MTTTLQDLVARLAARDTPRTEALVQADVRELLLRGPFDLTGEVLLESQVGDLRRIDVEVGATVIEVKKDLRKGNVRKEAMEQLGGYVQSRAAKFQTRYVGLLTDGAEWLCYQLVDGHLEEVTKYDVSSRRQDLDDFLIWLEGVLATKRDVVASPEQIRQRLGAGSSSHALDRSTLATLYSAHKISAAVKTRRSLWARLLETALGTQFEESDELFIEHTLLVNIADIIAHSVLGLAPETLVPSSILTGERFHEAQIFGVVEADFFDWVTEVPGGEEFIRTLARRISRFDWSAVRHDVLKVLYESVIAPEVRKRLGEYYTPDWLAEKVVEATVPDPLETRVLDPSCGSGTFLFHAVRRYIVAAKEKKQTARELLAGVTEHVAGMDLHPVAVSLARVTYLLAIGPELRTARSRSRIQVPVFLGDSLQWRQKDDLFTESDLSVPINDSGELFVTAKPAFRFPTVLLQDAQKFDALVGELADLASKKRMVREKALGAILDRQSVPKAARAAIEVAFGKLCQLHDDGRNHIWGYCIRNLARPVWLARSENKVDALIGNPPWLSYRFMNEPMQKDFKRLSEDRGLWHGAKVATHQDLSALFVVRSIERYLSEGGRFGFVLPGAAIDRSQYVGFRRGEYGAFPSAGRVTFDAPWDLRKLRPHFFPVAASAVFGRKTARRGAMPRAGELWSGRLPHGNATWAEVETDIVRATNVAKPKPSVEVRSEYNDRFRQGASVVPRLFFLVEKRDPGPLGQSSHVTRVASSRSANEKRPWKDLPALEGLVEKEFIFRMHFGETVLPYRTLAPRSAVLPLTSKGMLYPEDDKIHRYQGLSDWWSKAEEQWLEHRSSERLSLVKQLNFHNKLTVQFPLLPHRVLYSKSGMHLAAALIEDQRAVIDHTLYWGAVGSREEGLFVCAILNSAIATKRVRPLMSYGKDERHIDKYVWQLPIPTFDPAIKAHKRLADLGHQAEEAIGELDIDVEKHFSASRRVVREWLEASEVGQQIEAEVAALLG